MHARHVTRSLLHAAFICARGVTRSRLYVSKKKTFNDQVYLLMRSADAAQRREIADVL